MDQTEGATATSSCWQIKNRNASIFAELWAEPRPFLPPPKSTNRNSKKMQRVTAPPSTAFCVILTRHVPRQVWLILSFKFKEVIVQWQHSRTPKELRALSSVSWSNPSFDSPYQVSNFTCTFSDPPPWGHRDIWHLFIEWVRRYWYFPSQSI